VRRALLVIVVACWVGLSGWFWFSIYARFTTSESEALSPVPDSGEIAAALEAQCGEDNGNSKPIAALRVEPVYPMSARRKGIEGSVVLEFIVQSDGTVTEVKVTKSEPSGVFDRTAVHSVSSWHYCPRADSTKSRVRLDFKLNKPDPAGMPHP
jgi:protein TonB